MLKEEWVSRAYDQFVRRGLEADEKTWDLADLCWQNAQEGGFKLSPEDSADKEILLSYQMQGDG